MTKFQTAQEFSIYIEQTAIKEGQSCVDTIIEFCDERGLEFEDIVKLISPSLKGKLQNEMINNGLLPEQNILA